jgi:hypothetical protein
MTMDKKLSVLSSLTIAGFRLEPDALLFHPWSPRLAGWRIPRDQVSPAMLDQCIVLNAISLSIVLPLLAFGQWRMFFIAAAAVLPFQIVWVVAWQRRFRRLGFARSAGRPPLPEEKRRTRIQYLVMLLVALPAMLRDILQAPL